MLGFGGRLLFVAREEHEFVQIILESIFVEFERLLAAIPAPMVDCDSDGSGELDANSSGLNLCESESCLSDEVPLPTLFRWL